ncbi:MAG: NAD(P)H-hydrate epimerase [Elusimicrobia bacterium]|nr:NAD(P)H-hydrate epimerase [Elusimicrobiota bacterium]
MGKLVIPDTFQGYRTVTARQMQEIDQRAQEEFGVSAETLMENAGRAVAEQIFQFVSGMGLIPSGAKVVFCCGRGNNGGDGLVAARYLKQREVFSSIWILPPSREKGYGPLVSANMERAKQAGIEIQTMDTDLKLLADHFGEADILVDSLLGTGSVGKPAGILKKAIQFMNRVGKPIVAVDIPSGLDPDKGYHGGVFIKARWTLTLGLPKKGLLAAHAQPNVGELRVLDIGFPKELLS